MASEIEQGRPQPNHKRRRERPRQQQHAPARNDGASTTTDATMGDGGTNNKKRTRTSSSSVEKNVKCSFCRSAPAAVVLVGGLTGGGGPSSSSSGKSGKPGKPGGRPLCLLHYYTTRAARSHPVHRVRLLDGSGGDGDGDGDDDCEQRDEFRRQLDEVQSIFAEAYGDARREVAEASAMAHPPAVVSRGGSKGGKRRGTKPLRATGVDDPEEKELSRGGGFVRDLLLPERYVLQQERLAATSGGASGAGGGGGGFDAAAAAGSSAGGRGRGARPVDGRSKATKATRTAPGGGGGSAGQDDDDTDVKGSVGAAAAASAPPPPPSSSSPFSTVQSNPYRRRKNARISYWDVSGSAAASGGGKKKKKTTWEDMEREHGLSVTTTCGGCGSSDVRSEGNVTGRNNDMAKGETWGNKDRADVVMRWRCQRCGSAWHEEG